ncbi:MAG: dienelactone hydrolase family protein [Acidobacteriia bacterium]|nr:dienelactone hydrolase family protein [Terriglobia bacterium]
MKFQLKGSLCLILCGVCFALWLAPSLFLAAEVKSQTVSYPNGSETLSGYLALPSGPGPHPGLLLIHEWWGLNDWIKEQARNFAEQGYVALAVDLYRGKVAGDPDEAHELSRGLPQDRGISDLEAALAYLQSRPDVKKNSIGSVGWCMGGGYSIQLAIHAPRLKACIINYGALPTDPASINKIQAPVLGNFGAEDRGIPPAAVHSFEKAMQSRKKAIDVKIYDGAGHAFENPNNQSGYRQAAAKDAWQRMVAFLNAKLK